MNQEHDSSSTIRILTPDWPAPACVRAAATFRSGGASLGAHASLNLASHVGDAPAAVLENRRRLAGHLKLPVAPSWLNQVHGTRVVEAAIWDAPPEADGVYTCTAGVVCAVLTADCLPVLRARADGTPEHKLIISDLARASRARGWDA